MQQNHQKYIYNRNNIHKHINVLMYENGMTIFVKRFERQLENCVTTVFHFGSLNCKRIQQRLFFIDSNYTPVSSSIFHNMNLESDSNKSHKRRHNSIYCPTTQYYGVLFLYTRSKKWYTFAFE